MCIMHSKVQTDTYKYKFVFLQMQGHLKAAVISVTAYSTRPWLCNSVTGKEISILELRVHLELFCAGTNDKNFVSD